MLELKGPFANRIVGRGASRVVRGSSSCHPILEIDGLFAGGDYQGTGGTHEHLEGPLTSRSAVIVSQVQRQNTTSARSFSE